MDPQRWAAIESLYRAALAKEPEERPSYLAIACAEDPPLRSEVESLLAYADAKLEGPQRSRIEMLWDKITGIAPGIQLQMVCSDLAQAALRLAAELSYPDAPGPDDLLVAISSISGGPGNEAQELSDLLRSLGMTAGALERLALAEPRSNKPLDAVLDQAERLRQVQGAEEITCRQLLLVALACRILHRRIEGITPDAARCPQCDTVLPADSVAGFCPKCLLRLAIATEPEAADTLPIVDGVGVALEYGFELKNRYVIQSELGRGGFGIVYLAHDRQLHSRPVVIKVLLQGIVVNYWSQKKFAQERKALARIDHPGIVGVLDAGELPDGKPFLVMQFVNGVTLRSVLRGGTMDLETVASIVKQMGHALTAAHECGVWHCDLKPDNIMLQDLGHGEKLVKIIDFGIASVREWPRPQSLDSTIAAPTRVAGSVPYMAPEQLVGKPDASSDIYALGVIACEMLTGRRPFHADSAVELYSRQQQGLAFRLDQVRPGLPAAAHGAVRRALSFDAGGRYARARDFGDELASALIEPATQPASVVNTVTMGPEALEIAHVLFMGISGYSAMPVDRQAELGDRLQDAVRATAEFVRAQAVNELICLPSDDGMALVFFRDPAAPVRCALEVARSVRATPAMQLRMGIHTGPVYRRADINANRNVVGSAIRLAKRVMDCGNTGHILMSRPVADVLLQLSAWQSLIQEAGEREVDHGIRVRVFNLYDGEAGNPSMPAPPSAPERAASQEINFGRLVTKMCNRRPQEDAFSQFFLSNMEQSPGVPQCYVIHGEEGQCHESLVQRLIYRVEGYARGKYGEHKATVSLRKIPWQYDGTLQERRSRLLSVLIETCAPMQQLSLLDLSAAALGRMLSPSLYAFLVIQHDIRTARWDKAARELVEGYLTFWRKLPAEGPLPQVLVFLNVIYPPAGVEPGQRTWLQRAWLRPGLIARRLRTRRIKQELVSLRSEGPFLVLHELSPITHDDVMEWFSVHNIYDSEDRRLKRVHEIFHNAGVTFTARTMAEIESVLGNVHREFIAERGYV